MDWKAAGVGNGEGQPWRVHSFEQGLREQSGNARGDGGYQRDGVPRAGETASGHAPVLAVGYIGFPGAMCAAGFLPLQLRTVDYFECLCLGYPHAVACIDPLVLRSETLPCLDFFFYPVLQQARVNPPLL